MSLQSFIFEDSSTRKKMIKVEKQVQIKWKQMMNEKLGAVAY